MNSTYLKLIVILFLFIGETFSIYAEMIAARTNSFAAQPFINIFLKMFLIIAFAGLFLISGYMLGFTAFKNIWIVSVASITPILIMEPLLAYTIFKQLPTKGALVGLVLGALGFIAATIF